MQLTEKSAQAGGNAKHGLLVISLFAFASAGLVIAVSRLGNNPAGELTNKSLFLFLCSVLAVVLVAPSAYLVTRQRFDLFHPLVYPVITYLFPAFVVGSLTLATPARQSWVLTLISDPDYFLNLSLIYIIVGFISLVVGFALPRSADLGMALSQHIPDWKWSPSAIRLPGLLLLGVGTVFSLYGYAAGVLGYQWLQTPLLTGGVLSALAMLTTIGAFMLWHSYFRRDRTKREIWTPILILLVGQSLANAAISGSRYSLILGFMTVLAAYRFAGGRFPARVLILALCAALFATTLGLSVGTTYRQLKGSEGAISLVETLDLGGKSLEHLTDVGLTGTIRLAVDALGQRIETLSSFAVIVSNYERLRPLEADYGVANNIWAYTSTALIPRFLWPDKPLVSDARAVAALYFNFPTNSFAMTVFGDLLRNFGPIGVPLGMAFLGFALRVLYSTFVTQQQQISAWRGATYFLLLTNVNYESFYGTILPSWIRIFFICLIGGMLTNTVVRARSRSRKL